MARLRQLKPRKWTAVSISMLHNQMIVYSNCFYQECSRDYMEALKLDSQLLQFPHCLPNGNYDQLQCTGFACYCIDTQKMTKTSGLVVFSNVQELPCCMYNILMKFR